MFGTFRSSPARLEALERVTAWTRERFTLESEAAILVSELACTVPGCPPLETVVAFWTAANRRHHFRVFKPVADILAEDLPYAWQKNSLALPDGQGCDCC
ncbi:MAG: hypothetical protein WA210_14730 [Burkholderiaceae bacterium]